MEKPKRTCQSCQQGEPKVKFYRNAPDCIGCISRRSHAQLQADVDAFRAGKDQRTALRKELRKLAGERLAVKRARAALSKAKEANVRRLVPKAADAVQQHAVDAEMAELAQRVLVRRRLVEFVKEFHPRYKPGWVHHDICRRLEQFSRDVEDGKSPRLMILMPPRHGKSQIASKLYPAWHLGHFPHHEIISCSYNIALALDFSREVRGVIRSDRYPKLFPQAKLDAESQGAEAWKLASPSGVGAGGYVAAGIGGPINGKGAHVLIIDDPIKNAEEADSPDHLQKTWDWFNSTAYTRLAPGGGILVIQTWWSDNDLAGRLQEEMKGDKDADQYVVVKYPAIAMEDEEFRVKGDALHPERWPLPALERIRHKQGGEKGRFWRALYQQDPIPDDGAFFSKGMFVYRRGMPSLSQCTIWQAWDFAIGEKRINNWTVGVTFAQDHDDVAHLIELRRFRTADTFKIGDEILDMYAAHSNVMSIGVEDGQIWRGVWSYLQKRIQERRLYPSITPLKPLLDKTVRARPLQGRMAARKVTFPASAEWMPQVTKELLRFPGGMNDDIVDAMAWGVTLLLGSAPPAVPRPKQRPGDQTLAQKLRKLVVGGGGSAMSA